MLSVVVVSLMLLGGPARALAEELSPDSGPATYHDTSAALSSLTSSGTSGEASAVQETPPLSGESSESLAKDTSGSYPTPALMPATSANFDGIPEGKCECIPPDPSGAAGPTQYVEVVNTELDVYSKTGTPLLKEPVSTNTLWREFGSGRPCETHNDGDASVLFDPLSQRWVVQQFALGSIYADCVAVSKTSDATKEWYRYEFRYQHFPDYPKMGVWPDAYYMSFNLYNSGFIGSERCALNRAAMLEGKEASQQCFVGSSTGGSSLLPATVDGSTAPPGGQSEWFVGLSPTESNALAYWKFHVDWTNSANTTFTGPTNLPVQAFSRACGGFSDCVPQAETTTKLEALGDRILFRLAYRNFGGHQSMVVDHAVATSGGVGMRWYELRPTETGSLSVYQQGTYAPNSVYRWMGSIAMDKAGDMALGYSASSESLHPQIRYTGRLSTDALGSMPQGERTLYAGSGSQTNYHRWGDYTQMSVDPSDECTFWYVNQYQPSNGAFNWHTRIGSFKFPKCGEPPTVTTEAASNVKETEATLNGTINPNGAETSYYFEYGETESYGSKTAEVSVGSGTTNVKVSKAITGLSRGTTYHFRLVAKREGESSVFYGKDQEFKAFIAVLCKTTEEPCAEANRYGAGTKTLAKLKTGTSFLVKDSGGSTLTSCTASTLEGEVTGAGGRSKAPSADVSTASFSGCSLPTTAEGLPWHAEISRGESGTTETIAKMTVKINTVLYGLCVYQGNPTFTLTGGTQAELSVSGATLERVSGAACPTTATLSATYVQSSPSPFYLSYPPPLGSTVLCKNTEEPCAEANRYGAGTKTLAGLKTGTSLVVKDSGGSTLTSCTASTLEGEVTGAGGLGKAPSADVSVASFSGCSLPTTAEGLPWHAEIRRTEAFGAGTETIAKMTVKINTVLYGLCVYQGSPTFTLTGGTQAEFAVSGATLERVSGAACPITATLSATYVQSSPSPFYVSWPT
jgi:hypothetical protein